MNQRFVPPGFLSARPVSCFLCLLVLAVSPAVAAQQSVSLEGSTLQPIATLDQEVGNALGDLFKTKPKGTIGKVTVTQERAASLRLAVQFEGFEGNWLKGQALRAGRDGDPEAIVEIATEPVELGGSGEATVEFKLDSGVQEGASFESSRLVLLVAKRPSSRSGAESTFVLQKVWEAATRAENLEIRVRAKALQDLLPTVYRRAPAAGSRPAMGPSQDEVAVEHVRLRVGTRGKYTYLSAARGGGAEVRMASTSGDEETFQLGWIDKGNKIGRLRASNGWHLLALRSDGTVDTRSADPADPATVLHFVYNGDGTYIVEAADAAATQRAIGAAEKSRLRILGRPAVSNLAKSGQIRPQARPITVSPNLLKRSRALRAQSSGGSARLRLFHGPGKLEARPEAGSKRHAAFYFEDAPIPAATGRPGEGDGPAAIPAFDLAGVPVMQGYLSGRTADEGPDLEELLGINSQIWSDQNESSGIYYFLPAAYHLKWDSDKQKYDLSLTDEMSDGESEPHVLVRARLEPRFTPAQRRAAEILVRQAARASGRPFFDLRPMPIASGATTSTAGQDLARHHDVDDVGVAPASEVMGEVEVSWRMRAATRESFVELLRQDQAVAPQVLLQPGSGDGGTQRVPLYLSWGEPGSYPPLLWENGSFKRNELPHPIRLRGLHAMVLDADERVQVLSWDLSNTAPIPSRARAAMGQELTRPVIDNAFFTWVDFAVVPDDASTEAAVRSITGGVSERVRQPLEITLFDPLEASGARQLTVLVKSAYFEAGGDKVTAKQFEFSEDGASREIPFYLGRADVEVPFEWTVRLTMPDGEELERAVFLDGDSGLQLLVSRSSLRKIFGELPTESADR
ncbi:MAG: hypothetical protein ABFS14_11345 [Gemmatimonadota bacterium]